MAPNTSTISHSRTTNITMVLSLVRKVMYFGVLKKKTQASKVDWISFHPGTISIYVAGGGLCSRAKIQQPLSDSQIPHI